MRVLVGLIAAMLFVAVVMLAVGGSRDTGRSAQEIGVHQVAVEAVVQVEGDVFSEAACPICCHAACGNLSVAAKHTTDMAIAIAVSAHETRVYSLKLPLVRTIGEIGIETAFVSLNSGSHCVKGFPLKLPQYGRTRCTEYKS